MTLNDRAVFQKNSCRSLGLLNGNLSQARQAKIFLFIMKKILIMLLAILVTIIIFYLLSVITPFVVDYITESLSGNNNG